MFPGLKERLSKELISMVPEGVEVKVVAKEPDLINLELL
ncbi:MAG: hypothetical protein HeimC2_43070 [Candidatus Heimdallarchaeota archaeon LC_2]|nr:MAG: hypothetical protein HeimC2_43070 [Candidatus Heimdallarchaeota archaeon LC_2]